MSLVDRWHAFEAPTRALFESGRFSRALSLAIVGTAFASFAIRQLMGWGGLLGALGALVVLAIGSFVAHRDAIEWRGLLPISLLAYLAWCAASIFWSYYRPDTIGSVVYQLCFAFLGVYLALVRDTIQIVRTVGDVLRFLLAISLGLEILAGLLLDEQIRILHVTAQLDTLGPIQGVFGTRNAVGLIALIALVTFSIELRTRSIGRTLAWSSIGLAAAMALLSRSPVVGVVLVIVLFSMLALTLLRRVRDMGHRFWWQVALATFVVAAAVAAFIQRARIIELLSARSLLQVRYPVWIQMWNLSKERPLDGWGWTGLWRQHQPARVLVSIMTGAGHDNGLNAFLDVLWQVGIVGLLIFGILVVLALGRSWLVASNKRSIIHSWTPIVLIALIATSFTESVLLVDYGWLLLVICTVKASQTMSWRSALPSRLVAPDLR